MRAAFLLLAALSVLSCPPLSPARDSDTAEEEFAAEAVARKPGKARSKAAKPCREAGCRAIPRAKLVANRDSTYIDLLVSGDSLVRRWPVRVASPVRVWIAPLPADARLVERRASPLAHARDAFRAWEQVGVPVRFAFVGDSAEAEVHVRWTDSLPHQRAGIARRRTDMRNWLTSGTIVLALRDSVGGRYSTEQFVGVATHEVGHVLGLEHSDSPDDLMSPIVRATAPSVRDRATARVLYSLPAGRVR